MTKFAHQADSLFELLRLAKSIIKNNNDQKIVIYANEKNLLALRQIVETCSTNDRSMICFINDLLCFGESGSDKLISIISICKNNIVKKEFRDFDLFLQNFFKNKPLHVDVPDIINSLSNEELKAAIKKTVIFSEEIKNCKELEELRIKFHKIASIWLDNDISISNHLSKLKLIDNKILYIEQNDSEDKNIYIANPLQELIIEKDNILIILDDGRLKISKAISESIEKFVTSNGRVFLLYIDNLSKLFHRFLHLFENKISDKQTNLPVSTLNDRGSFSSSINLDFIDQSGMDYLVKNPAVFYLRRILNLSQSYSIRNQMRRSGKDVFAGVVNAAALNGLAKFDQVNQELRLSLFSGMRFKKKILKILNSFFKSGLVYSNELKSHGKVDSSILLDEIKVGGQIRDLIYSDKEEINAILKVKDFKKTELEGGNDVKVTFCNLILDQVNQGSHLKINVISETSSDIGLFSADQELRTKKKNELKSVISYYYKNKKYTDNGNYSNVDPKIKRFLGLSLI